MLGGPTLRRYEIDGLERVRPKLDPLRELVRLGLSARPPVKSPEQRAERWIVELRTADGLADGASQQALARVLFGAGVAGDRWRTARENYRLRVQRLVRAARRRLSEPLADDWFR